jgi:hypothetical protein
LGSQVDWVRDRDFGSSWRGLLDWDLKLTKL